MKNFSFIRRNIYFPRGPVLHRIRYEEYTHSFVRKILNKETTWDINAPKRLQSFVKVGITEVGVLWAAIDLLRMTDT